MIKIANAQFWVHDHDAVLDFYTRTLGWEVRADNTMEEWNFRWLVVGPTGQDDVGLVPHRVEQQPLPLDGRHQVLVVVAAGQRVAARERPRTR